MRLLAYAFGMVIGASVLGACASSASHAQDEPVIPDGPPPSYEVAASEYNERLRYHDRVWARAIVQVRAQPPGEDEKRQQAEGFLQIARPSDVALQLGKLGDTLFYLGSDDDRYWWFDLSGDQKLAVIGTHDRAGPETAGRLGIPVHPLELVGLLGFEPLPDSGGSTLWGADGSLVIEAPGIWGSTRRIETDAQTGRTLRSMLVNVSDEILVSAEYDGQQELFVEGANLGVATVPERYLIRVPGEHAEIRLVLNGAENRDLRAAAFDLDGLLRRFRVDQVIDLDEPPAPLEPRAGGVGE